MKILRFNRFGLAPDVVELVDVAPAPAPGRGEVRVAMLASPINPSDLLKTEGRYGASPVNLPQVCGVEGVGRVLEVGHDVDHLSRDDLVLLRFGGQPVWAEALTLNAARLFPLPKADPVQLSMLAANPATASLMLQRAGDLQPGDWILQNAANSGVGQCVIQLARERGLRTVNFVRTEKAAERTRALGGDVILLEGEEVPAACSRTARLAFDAIGGPATAQLARHLADGGKVISYGLLSGRNAEVDPSDLIFRGVGMEGFWLAPWADSAGRAEIERVYRPLADLMVQGRLKMGVERIFELTDHHAALSHAARGGRAGKIIFRGP